LTAYAVRIIAAFLTFLYTTLSLATCTAEQVSETQVAALEESVPIGASGPVTVTILQPRADIGKALQESADFFLESTGSDARIHIQTVNGQAAYRGALRARLLSGEQVDLFHIFGARDLAELSSYVKDISEDLPWAGEAMEGLLDPVSAGEKIYGIPYAVEGVGLIANASMFEAADISLAEINTFQDLTEAFLSLRQEIDGGALEESFPRLEAVTEFPAHDKVFVGEQLVDIALTGVFSTPQQASQAVLLGLMHGEAVEEYIRNMARYCVTKGDWGALNQITRSRQVEDGIASGRVAVIQQNVNIASGVHRVDKDISRQLTLLPIPLEGMEQGSVYVGSPSYWAVNKGASPESARVAGEFLTWLYQSEAGAMVLADQFSAISPYRETAKSTGFSLHSQLLAYIGQGRALPWIHAETPPGWGSDVFRASLQEYLADTMDWEQMQAAVMEGWGGLLS